LGFSKLEVTREVWYTRRILGFFKLEDTQHSIYPRSAYSALHTVAFSTLATYRNEGLYATLQKIGQYIEH